MCESLQKKTEAIKHKHNDSEADIKQTKNWKKQASKQN